MIGPRNLHPDELGEAEGMELQDALRVGNRLVEAMEDVPLPADEDFVDNVMAALAEEPTPGTTGFLAPVRRGAILGGFVESFRQAWASLGAGRPLLGRSAALAYVLAVAVAAVTLTGAATLGAAGVLGLLNASPTETPALPTPAPITEPAPTVAPSPSPTAPDPTDAPTPSPTETEDEPEGSDDSDGDSGAGGEDDEGEGRETEGSEDGKSPDDDEGADDSEGIDDRESGDDAESSGPGSGDSGSD